MVTKLYRKEMADLAGMTPVQHDYFVRIGAFGPDQGTTRKWYSPIEASMVMIAGQLMNYFKDQRHIVGVIEGVRDCLTLGGEVCETIVEARQYQLKKEFVDSEEFRLQNPGHMEKLAMHGLESESSVDNLILSMGYLPDLDLEVLRSKDPSMSHDEKRIEGFRRNVSFAEECCKRNGIDFESALKSSKDQLETALKFRHKYNTVHEGWVVCSYFEIVGGFEVGNSTVYLQVAANEDGSAQVQIDNEPTALDNRILWLSLDLEKLFKRLSRYVPDDFIPLASAQLAAWDKVQP